MMLNEIIDGYTLKVQKYERQCERHICNSKGLLMKVQTESFQIKLLTGKVFPKLQKILQFLVFTLFMSIISYYDLSDFTDKEVVNCTWMLFWSRILNHDRFMRDFA